MRALGRRRRANRDRLASGKKPILGGKPVTPETFRRKTGASASKRDAQRRQKAARKK